MSNIYETLPRALERKNTKLFSIAFELIHRARYWLLFVIAPTLITAGYYYIFAADQYESVSAYVVRKADSSPVSSGALGQVFGFSFGNSASQSEAFIVHDFLLSHDAVSKLRKDADIVARYRRPGIDYLSRLWFANPTPETLQRYYLRHVSITEDQETAISHLSVTAFTPDDAVTINRQLLRMGEDRINALNARTFRDQVSQSEREYKLAETELQGIQSRLTALRVARGDIDPQGTGRAQIGLVSTLTGALVDARSRLTGMGRMISHNSPQYLALAAQVSALEAQISGQQGRLASQNGNTIATNLGDYEALVVRREFAAQRFTAAAAAFEQAKSEARKKQLYLVRVVEPNTPVRALLPERSRIVLTVFAALFLAFAIARMLITGIKEHAL